MFGGLLGRARSPDDLVQRFRWMVTGAAVLLFVAFDQPSGLTLAAALAIVGVACEIPAVNRDRRLRRRVQLAQLAADTVIAAWAIVVAAPTQGDPLWSLLLLPVIEGATRARMVGALSTWTAGVVIVHVGLGGDLGASSVIRQATVLAVTVGVGLVSQQLEERLVQLARARRETDRRAELLTVVATAARTVTTLDPQRVLEAVTEAALQLGFDMSEICVIDDEGVNLVPVAQRGWPEHHPPTGQPAHAGVAGHAFTTRRTVVVGDYQSWPEALPEHLNTGIARSAAGTPIMVGDAPAAVLTVANRTVRDVTDYELDCLELLGTQAGVALRNAQLYDLRRQQQRQLEHQATHDPLTGLANRAFFLDRLHEQVAAVDHESADPPVTVLFVDLDDFKQVNDSHGHRAGDRLLRVVAERLRRALRPGDLVARYGGDEFTVLLAHAAADPEAIAQRLLDAVSAPLSIGEDVTVSLGCSIGMASQRPGDDVDSLLLRADQAMYRAKSAGRGCFAC